MAEWLRCRFMNLPIRVQPRVKTWYLSNLQNIIVFFIIIIIIIII